MDSYYDVLNSLGLPFFSKRKPRKLVKYAILLNEPTVTILDGLKKEQPCALANELLPGLSDRVESEDLVQMIGEILEGRIKAHAPGQKVAFMKPDKIIKQNAPSIVPVMYRITAEEFAQNNKSTFKIIECRNSTKLVSDWKPTLPDKLITLGHQVVVVQLEDSFVPYTDFAYAILRQLDYEWTNRLPKSFFYPDDVCKVQKTVDKDLCVVSPSMPDGDLDINKKMGLLNYEVLMMIKTSCMGAMKNYLIKRDLRVGKFSDTLDGVSSLRYLYRKLQEKLTTELRFHAPETDEVDDSDKESEAPVAEGGNEQDDENAGENPPTSPNDDKGDQESFSDEEDFKLEDFVEFRTSLERIHDTIVKARASGKDANEDDDFPEEDFAADAIIKMLKLPDNTDDECSESLEEIPSEYLCD